MQKAKITKSKDLSIIWIQQNAYQQANWINIKHLKFFIYDAQKFP